MSCLFSFLGYFESLVGKFGEENWQIQCMCFFSPNESRWMCTGEDNNMVCFLLLSFLKILQLLSGHTRKILSCSQKKSIHCCNSSYDGNISTFIMRSVFHINSNVYHMTKMVVMEWPNIWYNWFSVLWCGRYVMALNYIS